MFGTQHEYYQLIKKYVIERYNLNIDLTKPSSQALLNSFSGFFAGLTEATLTPFERIQSVLQIEKYHSQYKNTFHAFGEIIKTHGVKELYRGFNTIALRNGLSNTIFFGLRKPIKDSFPKPESKINSTLYDFLSGGMLGAFISTLFYPLNVIKSNMQAKIGGEHISLFKKFKIVYEKRDKQLSLFNKGIKGNFWRAVLSWGLTNSAFEFYLSEIKRS